MNVLNVRHRKVGGIWFLRIGRLQFSFCLCRGFDQRERRPRAYRGGRTIDLEAARAQGSIMVAHANR